MIMNNHNILIVEDEDIIRTSLRKLLERHDFTVSEAISVKAAQQSFNLNDFDLVISDLRLPGSAGTDLIKAAGNVPVMIMTSYASLRSAVDVMRQGAADYVSKPFDHDEMLNAVRRILGESKQACPEPNRLLMGNSPEILKILRTVHKAAPTSAPVLIHGENGTGRRTIAETIYAGSSFAGQPFITINCASVRSAELSQILEQDGSGTLFLNNICELPGPMQPQILRAMQQGNFRFIASVEQDLRVLSQTGRFRKDLFYSLNVVKIQVPTLRERAGDIPALIDYFIDRYSSELNLEINLSSEARQALLDYSWPGNVQELQNIIYQGAILAETGEVLNADMLGLGDAPQCHDEPSAEDKSITTNPAIDRPVGLSLEDYFTSFVLENQENMSETALAQKLGISRKSLWERRNKLGISRKKA
jgi:DNA-binding NtrC family response regulator